MKKENRRKSTWYERVFNSTDLPNSRPELAPYIGADNVPKWLLNVSSELFSQNMPTIPIKKLREITPDKLGRFLGQKCANVYAVAEKFQFATQGLGKLEAAANQLQQHKDKPQIRSFLHTIKILSILIKDSPKSGKQVKINVLQAFKKALHQPNHKEAADFFLGFAKGLSMKGFTSNGAARRTTATPIYQKMFFNWQEVNQLSSVPEFKNYLLKNGFTEATIGHISRLRKLCTRVGYAPGKRGHPSKLDK